MTTDTHASPDKDALEREIIQTRDALVGTVDAIVDRVDPSKVADRTTEQLKRNAHRASEQAQEKAHEVQQQAKAFVEEDPDRAKLMGAGALAVLLLAWFLGRRSGRA